MPYQLAAPAAMPARHAAVALLFDQGPGSVSSHLERVRLHAGVTESQACRLVCNAVADIPGMATTVVGTGLAGAELTAGLPGQVHGRAAGQPSTGVWWELAAGLPGPVLLADYDPGLGHLGLAVIEIPGE